MGRIPIFLYNDLPWIPYQGTNLSAEHFGFIGRYTSTGTTIPKIITAAMNLTDEQYQEKLNALQDARFHYTFPGILNQFEHFLRDPFGPEGGQYRCIEHPKTAK